MLPLTTGSREQLCVDLLGVGEDVAKRERGTLLVGM